MLKWDNDMVKDMTTDMRVKARRISTGRKSNLSRVHINGSDYRLETGNERGE